MIRDTLWRNRLAPLLDLPQNSENKIEAGEMKNS